MKIKVHKEVEIQNKEMKMCKTIPTFILLFTGTTLLAQTPSHVTETPHQETAAAESKPVPTRPENGLSPVPEKRLSSTVVSGISISLVIILICVIAFLWFKWKSSKESSAEINSDPSSEAVVTLKNTKL